MSHNPMTDMTKEEIDAFIEERDIAHKRITDMTEEEIYAYIEWLRPHLEALGRGEQYMMDTLADVAGAIVAEAPIEDVPITILRNAPPEMVYFIDTNDPTISAVLDMSADGEESADD